MVNNDNNLADKFNSNSLGTDLMTEVKSDKNAPFIPSIPENYCFFGENFSSSSFSVDGFVLRNSKRVNSLEKLKEHLHDYLKILKQSMTNLINEEYVVFINLSENLVSFDKSIQKIQTPVLRNKNEASNVKSKIDEIINSLTEKQDRLKTIREYKQKLNMILEILQYLDRIEANIELIDSKIQQCNDDIYLKKQLIYPALNENSVLISKLNTNFTSILNDIDLKKSGNTNQFITKMKQRFDIVWKRLYEMLENEILFLLTIDSLKLKNEIYFNDVIIILEQLFSTYLIDGNQQELQMIIANNIVRPYFATIICDKLSKNDLELVFNKIYNFIDEKCFLLIQLLTKSNVLSTFKFQFIISIIWNTFVDQFLLRAQLMLKNSNPQTFQENYFQLFKFIENFLAKTFLMEYRSQFEQVPSYLELRSKFKLNVYFYMQLHKISTNIEEAFIKQNYSLNETAGSKFKLNITETVYHNLIMCWPNLQDNNYIGDLFIYLWKLTAKIISRFSKWIVNTNLENIHSMLKTNLNLNDANLKIKYRQILSALVVDSHTIINELTILFNDKIEPLWNSYYNKRLAWKLSNDIDGDTFKRLFQEFVNDFKLSAIDKSIFYLKTEIIDECKQLLNHVNDIPRLYRRTNKEKPNEASAYICNCIHQLVDCISMVELEQTNQSSKQWLNDILLQLSQHYKNLTLEVLTSVQKTEDSLKKLKKLKINTNLMTMSNTTMSDDDKIRLQIYFDVNKFGYEVINFNFRINLC